MTELISLIVPFAGTTLGAMMVFFMKDGIKESVEKGLLGFAAGVMFAATVWSLIIPAINSAQAQGQIPWLSPVIGFTLGIIFLLAIDSIVPHLHLGSNKPEGVKSGLSKTTMLLLAVTIHNIPEGMAVGVAYAGAVSGNTGINMMGAFALSVGIAIQNFPEGAIISLPLKGEGMNKGRAFYYGMLSGAVEPVAGFLTALVTAQILPFMPYILSFAAGAMFYVIVEELIPESQMGEHSNIGTIGAAIGFMLMMVLDVALG